jgi:RNA polymerase sigma-70 factor (ECF subfamily)
MALPSPLHGFPLTLPASVVERDRVPDFKQIYDEHLPFMWRAAHYLGVLPSAIEDVLQDVFLVVHRRLRSFERRSTVKTWMYGILLHVVRNHRRTLRRGPAPPPEGAPPLEDLAVASEGGPEETLEAAEAMRTLHALLDELDEARREVFVLVELEQLGVPEIAELTGEKPNTIYGRLRTARQQFDAAVRRHRSRERRTR